MKYFDNISKIETREIQNVSLEEDQSVDNVLRTFLTRHAVNPGCGGALHYLSAGNSGNSSGGVGPLTGVPNVACRI